MRTKVQSWLPLCKIPCVLAVEGGQILYERNNTSFQQLPQPIMCRATPSISRSAVPIPPRLPRSAAPTTAFSRAAYVIVHDQRSAVPPSR